MRAIVMLENGDVVYREDVEVRDVRANEARVRVVAAGFCGSDLSVIKYRMATKPAVLGHEGAGIVEAVGPGVSHVRPGDHVVISTIASCGHCKQCAAGRPVLCRASSPPPAQPFTMAGQPLYNFPHASSFAENIVVPAVQLIPIPPDVPFTSACLMACGVLTGVGAVFNRASVRVGQTAAVIGVGGVGLNAVQALRIKGASRIVAIDALPGRESLARQFGATDFLTADGAGELSARVRDLLGAPADGLFGAGGVDWSFNTAADPAVTEQALKMLDWGGTCVQLGFGPEGLRLDFDARSFLQIERGFVGCRMGSTQPHYDIPMLVGLYRSGTLKLDELVSRTYPLDGFRAVIDDLSAGTIARGVFDFTL